jgi:hypothetical protein
MTAFGADVLQLTLDPFPVLLALPLVRLLRSPAHAALVVLNLWLFMELMTTVLDPSYRFGGVLPARLVASCLHLALACGALQLWRYWRYRTESVTVH